MQLSPTERFTNRAELYARHRPGYPRSIVDVLHKECGLTSESRIADIAAGTGLLTKIFLEHLNPVIAIEPNAAMLAYLATLQNAFPNLSARSGTAEASGLPDQSVDFIVVGQAMHWFDLEKTREEFKRILQPDGWVVVIYNERRRDGDAFHGGYEDLLETYGANYQEVQSRHLTETMREAFFSPCAMERMVIENAQDLDLEGLTGRIVSSSYMPTDKDATYPAMMKAINSLFEKSERSGKVRLEYACSVSFGHLDCA
jgi:SAM-dependent methyltransferase